MPQLIYFDGTGGSRILAALRCSTLMGTVISFELDVDCIFPDTPNDSELFFTHLSQLTHLRITVGRFNHCIHLLNQLGPQLHSFDVSIVNIPIADADALPTMTSVSKSF